MYIWILIALLLQGKVIKRVPEVGANYARLTLYLFVWQWRNGNEGEFLGQSFVEPIEVFVPSGHLDVIETGRELVSHETLESVHFGLLFGRGDIAAVRRLDVQPTEVPVAVLRDLNHVALLNVGVNLSQHEALSAVIKTSYSSFVLQTLKLRKKTPIHFLVTTEKKHSRKEF